MRDERHVRINDLLNEALDRDTDARSAYLDASCGSDHELRQAVESLLAQQARTGGLIAEPLFDAAAAMEPLAAAAPAAPAGAGSRHERARVTYRRAAFFWVALVLGGWFVLLSSGAVWKVSVYGNAVSILGWTAVRDGGAWRIETVDPAGPAAGLLRNGDVLLAFNGDPRIAAIGPRTYRQFLPVGSSYSLLVRRDRADRLLRLPFARASVPGTAMVAAIYFTLAAAFCAMGLLMGLSRPADPVTRAGCLAGCIAGYRLLGLGLAPYRGLGEGFAWDLDVLVRLFDPWHFAISYYFLLLFSLPAARGRLWPALGRAISAICAVMFCVAVSISLATLTSREQAITLQNAFPLLVTLNNLFFQSSFWDLFQITAFAACAAVVLRGYRQAEDPDQRLRIRWVVFGCLLAFGPLVILLSADFVLRYLGDTRVTGSAAWQNLGHAANAFMLAVPVSLAYAVVRHRVLGVSMVMRRSMQYVLAKRVLQVCLMLPIAGVLLPLASDPDRLAELFPAASLYVNVALLATFALGLKYHERLRAWLDRRFFREAYARELFPVMFERIQNADSVNEVARLIAGTVSAALHPSFACVVSRQSPDDEPDILHLSGSNPVQARALARAAAPCLPPVGARKAFFQTVPSTAASGFASALVVPIDRRNRRIGFLLLGDKLSEEPYTAADLDLLHGIADQAAVVHENLWWRAQQYVRECRACGTCFDADVDRCQIDGLELSRPLPVKRIIDGKYRLDRRLGAGGMGRVYEAFEKSLKRQVAVKFMLGESFGDQAALRRFDREAQAMGRLDHPNIVPVFAVGRIRSDGAYLVMQRVHGTSWRAVLADRRTLPPRLLAGWMDQLLDGLEAAHRAGVVHRDLKPENVLISPLADGSERVVLVDFGIAKLDEGPTGNSADHGTVHMLTAPGVVLGTAGYMSPEQRRGQPCDERGDVFAAATMALEAVTGIAPWKLDGPVAAAVDAVGPALGAAPCVGALQDVLRECLNENPEQRVRTASEMRRLLVPALLACADAKES
jgi:tRNA A-37 threonylcarbamoyl transferase component Bud32